MEEEKKVNMKELIEKGKSTGTLSNNDIMEALEFADFDIDQIEKLYETLENNGIEVTSYVSDGEFEEIENEVEKLESAEERYRRGSGVAAADNPGNAIGGYARYFPPQRPPFSDTGVSSAHPTSKSTYNEELQT